MRGMGTLNPFQPERRAHWVGQITYYDAQGHEVDTEHYRTQAATEKQAEQNAGDYAYQRLKNTGKKNQGWTAKVSKLRQD